MALPSRAGSHNPEALALQHDIGGQQPLPRSERGRLGCRLLGDREHQTKHVLGHKGCVNPRLIRDDDAALPSRFEIDGIRAHRAGSDESQICQLRELGFAPGDGRAGIEDHPGILYPRDLLSLARGPISVHHDLAPGREALECGGIGDLGRIIPGDDDFHGLTHSPYFGL